MTAKLQGYRISPRQQRILQRQSDGAPFEACLLVEIVGPVDVVRLADALRNVMAAHEILRTRFASRKGLRWPLQVVDDASSIAPPLTDPHAVPHGAWPSRVEDWPLPARTGMLDLAVGPLLDASLIRCDAAKHFLALRVPSLCADAQAMGVLFEQLIEHYAASPPPSPSLQYAHYADWQLGITEDPASTAPGPGGSVPGSTLVLPGEDRSHGRSFHDTESVSFTVQRAIVDWLAARASGKPRDVVLSAWFALLSRLGGQSLLYCEVAFEGRLHEELRTTLGPIDRYLAIGCMIEAATRFGRLVERVGHACLDVQGRFERNELEHAGDGVAGPAADPEIAFDYLELPRERRVADTRFRVTQQRARLDRFKLRLSCAQDEQEIRGELHYDPEVLGRDAVSGLARSLVALLRHAAEDPDRMVSSLGLLDAAEQDRMLALGTGPAASSTVDLAVHERFARQVAQAGARVAVEAGDLRWTYAELDERAERVARRLRREGVGPEVFVAVALDTSVPLIVALLGVFKAGGVYVPLDPRDPPRRLATALAAAQPRVVITRDRFRTQLPEGAAPILLMDDVGSFAEREDSSPMPRGPEVLPEHLAYVIFTSGSTGEPKGVCVSHRAFANYLDWCQQAYEIDEALESWVHSPAAFDLGHTALIAPIAMGRKLRFVPAPDRPEALGEMLPAARSLGLLKLTPSHLRALRHQVADASELGSPVMVVGGESLYYEDLAAFRAPVRPTPIRIFNEYGPTEAAVGCCVHEVTDRDAAGRSGPVSIGRPIPGMKMYVLDDEMRPLPAGVKGALYIGGLGLARGYLRAPALTADRFVPDPFSAEPGMRLYRTGDIASIGADGNFEFFGRNDDQVKIRGHRVELAEIEIALRRHPAVGESAVLVHRGPRPGTDQLLGFITPRPELGRADMPDVETLRDVLRQWLPEAAIPASITVVDRLLRAPSGKLDRSALEAAAAATASGPLVPPRDDVEQILAGVWSQVLGIERIGIDDNFFTLGGDSIRSIQIVALARARAIELSLDQVLASPTIRALAARARAAHPEASLPATAPFALIDPEDRELMRSEDIVDAYPLAALQAGMIFHNEMAGGAAVYHDIFSFHIEAPFDEARLRAAARALVARHPVCRTTFDLGRFSQPLQLVHRTGADPLSVEDLRQLSPEDQERAIAAYLDRERARRLDVTALPLIRYHVQRRSDSTFQFNLSFHHAVIDGWSDATMLSELFHHYLSELEGKDPALEPPRANFRDFIVLERQAMESPETTAFWERTLAGSTPFRLAGVAGQAVARHMVRRRMDLPLEICRGLRALALAQAVPLKTVMLTAHFAAMRAVQGDDDVLSCMVSSGRIEGTDGDRVLGLFINSIPIRARLEGGTWQELVQQMLQVEQQILPHRRLPLAELQRRQGGQRLTDVLFYFTDYHVYRSRDTFHRFKLLGSIPHEETSFPLSVSFEVDPLGPGVQFDVMADEALLGRETIDLVESCILEALSAMSKAPGERYEAHSLLPGDVRRRLVGQWNATRRTFAGASDLLLHELFDAQAERTPDAIAVASADGAWTYTALRDKADQLARHLVTLGVGPESVVGVFMPRCPEVVIALLGVLKAGAAYLPLDPEYPADRLAFMLEESAAPAIITRAPWIEACPRRAGTALVDVDAPPEHPGGRSAGVRPDPDNPAYVIYTSGSTGRPKGVVNTHRGILNRILWMQEAYGLTPADRVIHKTPFGFDVSVWELFWPLAFGAAMVVAPADAHRDPSVLGRTIEDHGVTVTHFVPSLLDAFLEQVKDRACASLRLIVCSGEELTKGLCDRVFARMPTTALANLYGPTEAAIDVTAWNCRPGDPGPVPIGTPIANMQTYVLDNWMEPVPVGVIGHLYLGGVGLARGYLGRAALTAERFVPDPFSGEPNTRLYCTGDLARYRPDGNVEFCGRSDHQVKLRGVRVELGEIEAAIAERPGVRAAAARVFGERGAPLVLAAYVVKDDPALTAEELRGQLRKRLADPVVPSFIVFLDSLPVTANGKLDRRALPDPRRDAAERATGYTAPRTEMETLVASAWAETLGVPRVGRDDNFFLVGGHSLLLVRVVSRLRRLLKLPLPIRIFHERPTLTELAEAIDAIRKTGARDVPAVTPVEPGAAAPLSFVQEGISLVERTGTAGPAYHIPIAVRINGELDRGALAAALEQLVERHEILQTSFTETSDGPAQRSVPHARLSLEVTEAAPNDDTATHEWMQGLARRPFDLATPPLLRAALRSIGTRDHVLLLVVHHLVADGWSMGVLIRDLVELYDARVRGRPAQLPALPFSYAAYATWQRAQENSEAWKAHREYWRARLSQLPPPLDLAGSRPRPEHRAYRGARIPLALPSDLSSALRQVAAGSGTTLYAVLLAGFLVLLAHQSGHRDIVVGTDVAGRELPGAEDLVGCLVNQLVLRTRIPREEDPSFRTLVALVRQTLMEAYDHQSLPFEVLLRELKPRREPGRPPLFQVKMVFQQTPVERLDLANTTFAPIATDSGASKWDLLLELWDGRDGIAGALTFDAELFDPSFARFLIEGLTAVLQAVAADPEAALSTLEAPLARAAEHHRKARAAAAASDSRRLFQSARTRKAATEEAE